MQSRLNIKSKISNFLCIDQNEVEVVIKNFRYRYKRYSVNKKSGGSRFILHPCREIKSIQYAICKTVLDSIPCHNIAYAYIPGKQSPLKQSADKHSLFKYTLRIDFKDFFPSIKPQDLLKQLKKFYDVDYLDCNILSEALFYSQKGTFQYMLPVGAPSSPVVSNIVMRDIDEDMLKASKAIDAESALTRYADDVYFSSNIRGLCHKFYDCVAHILKEYKVPELNINVEKTLFLSRGTKRIVNGLYITPDGDVSIGRERKALIKSFLYKFSQKLLDDKDIVKAQGMLAFIQDCEPNYYNKLALKYGDVFYEVKEFRRVKLLF